MVNTSLQFNKALLFLILVFGLTQCHLVIGRLLRPDIVHFRSACGGTEIFLRELALSNMLS
jgi:hypothetical protein